MGFTDHILKVLALSTAQSALNKVSELVEEREQRIADDPEYAEKVKQKAQKRAERAEKVAEAWENWQEKNRQAREDKKQAKQAAYEKRLADLRAEYPYELIYSEPDGFIAGSEFHDPTGALKYSIEGLVFLFKRQITVKNKTATVVATLAECKPLFTPTGHRREPVFIIKAYGVEYDAKYNKIEREYHLEPYDWHIRKTSKREYTIFNSAEEPIFSTVYNKEDASSILFFKAQETDLLTIALFLLMNIESAYGFSPSYDRYVMHVLSTAHSG